MLIYPSETMVMWRYKFSNAMLEILDHVQDVITRWSDNVKENLKRSEQKTHLIISKLCHFSLHLKVLCCHLKEMIRDG